MNRRTFSTALLTDAASSLMSARGMAANATPEKARNVVLVHGPFTDGSAHISIAENLHLLSMGQISTPTGLEPFTPKAAMHSELPDLLHHYDHRICGKTSN